MRQHLSAAQVAELAELLEEAPVRVGVIDAVLEAAARNTGMTLVLAEPPVKRRSARIGGAGAACRPDARGGDGGDAQETDVQETDVQETDAQETDAQETDAQEKGRQ